MALKSDKLQKIYFTFNGCIPFPALLAYASSDQFCLGFLSCFLKVLVSLSSTFLFLYEVPSHNPLT